MKELKITFIQTGGTIDKDYPKTGNECTFEIGDSAIQRVLEKINPAFRYEIITAFKKDSLEIDSSDRNHLLALFQKQSSTVFIIPHGTGTLKKTGKFLEKNLNEKLVILTVAQRSIRFNNSDAALNIGTSIGAVNTLTKDSYIAMNGITQTSNSARRNKKN